MDSVSAFNDSTLPFFSWHADLWFLLAIWRVAVDHPKQITTYTRRLSKIAGDQSFPHAGMREIASQIIILCHSKNKASSNKALVRKARSYRSPKCGKIAEGEHTEINAYQTRPKDRPEIQPSFHFEYDFDKHEITALARLFGVPKWDVEDRSVRWIRKRDTTIKSMYDFGQRSKPSFSTDYSRGTRDRFHSYGTYLAWHALALVGGELSLQRPVVQNKYYSMDTWEDWIRQFLPTRHDGYWIADGTDRYPAVALHELLLTKDKERFPIEDKEVMARLAGFDLTGSIQSKLTIEANWDSPDDVSVTISSVLCPNGGALDTALAVATAERNDLWLPTLRAYEDDEGEDFEAGKYSPMEAWIVEPDVSVYLDEYDPAGARTALTRARISKAISNRLRIKADSLWSRQWKFSDGKLAATSLAWGLRSGVGEGEIVDAGTALICERRFLRTLLKGLKRSLILVVRLQHYRKTDRYSDELLSGDPFRYSHLVCLIDENLRHTIVDPNAAQIAAIAALPKETRYKFEARLSAIRTLGGAPSL